MPRQTKEQKRRAALRRTIERALSRELTKMEAEESGRITDWGGDALASWIAPGVIRSVERALKV